MALTEGLAPALLLEPYSSSIFKMSSFLPKVTHENQQAAAVKIVQAFAHGNYAILWALCQSGKSGTFHWVARQMLELGHCERVYILCGSAEVGLRKQAEKDLKNYNADLAPQIQVLFRTAFKKSHMDIENALIIIDESHLDQTKGMELDTFLQDHDLNLTGNCETAVANNCHILSVSATPYAEIAALKAAERREEPVHKAIVHLRPGKGYIGIKRLLKRGRIVAIDPKEPITGKTVHEFAAFMRDPEFHGKYCIMRVKNKAAARAVVAAKKLGGYAVVSYTSEDTDIAITEAERDAHVAEVVKAWRRRNPKSSDADEAAVHRKAMLNHPWLGEAPLQTTVILLKDRLRAGKVVPKEHIGFVWEDATTSKTDTLVQGLLGRMCGYYKPGQYVPKIFLPKAVVEEHEGCVMPQSELQRAISWHMLPRNHAHSCPQRLTKTPDRREVQTIPIKFKLPGDWYTKDGARRDPALLKRAICELRTLFETSAALLPSFTEDQMCQMMAILAQEEEELVKIGRKGAQTLVAQRNLHCVTPTTGSHPNWWPKLAEAVATSTSMHGLGDEITGNPSLVFAFVYENYPLASKAEEGCVYAIFYLDSEVDMKTLSHRHRYGHTDEKELYSPGGAPLPTIWESSVPAFTGRFPRACFEDPELLTGRLRGVLHLVKSGSEDIRCLEDAERGFFAFRKAAFSFVSEADNELVRICEMLGREVGMTIHVDFKPKLARKMDSEVETFHVRQIRWSKTV